MNIMWKNCLSKVNRSKLKSKAWKLFAKNVIVFVTQVWHTMVAPVSCYTYYIDFEVNMKVGVLIQTGNWLLYSTKFWQGKLSKTIIIRQYFTHADSFK